MTDENDVMPYVVESLRPILDELHERLEGDLSVQDWVAFSTAISKAAIAGWRQFEAAITFDLRRQGYNLIADHPTADAWDEWADRYGEDAHE